MTFRETVKAILSQKIRNSVSTKLMLSIGILVLLGSIFFWFTIIVRGEKEFLKASVNHALNYNLIIEKSLELNMLSEGKENVQQIVENITNTGIIKKTWIYKHPEGRITFSSDKKEIGVKIRKNSGSCNLCHRGKKSDTNWAINETEQGRILTTSRAIKNRKSCSTAACHAHPPDKAIIAILETEYSLYQLDKTLAKQKVATIQYAIVLVIIISVVLCMILWQIIIYPLTLIADGMKRVSKGDLDYKIMLKRRDEMGMLADIFNSMTEELKTARQRLENWAKELEEEVKRKTEEIRKSQEQMVHTEKLASLGRMAAGVAHELNSPLTGIVTFAHLMLQRIPPENKMDREDLEVIIEQAERCSRIIKGLLSFSRAMVSEKKTVNINSTISHVLEMIRNQAKFHNIKIKTELSPDLPEIEADPSQLQQVYMNLLINAADAMNDRGEIKIATRSIKEDGMDFIEIEFTDTGPGIPEEYLDKIFEPFFTTKPVGKGTGLGLAVTHGIVKKHGGHILVKSTPGKGTTFLIRLPIKRKDEKDTGNR